MTELTINSVIVHELFKEAKKPMNPDKKIKFRDTVLDPTNNTVIKLINEINGLYGKKGNSAYYGDSLLSGNDHRDSGEQRSSAN